ncbi:MAG: nucleoside hydrolase [Eubacteriales bacterium]|nr:nucleoside hydrolase [Eubacteriales bacterium]
MDKKIRAILDCDPGHDDAIALLWLLASGRFDLRAVTTVSGNQTIEKVTQNAANLLSFAGFPEIPLGRGFDQGILGRAMTGAIIHGESGLDGPELPQVEVKLDPRNAIELMADILRAETEPLTLIATGPLSNVARLLLLYPELKAKIERIALMGGGTYGNWTPAAEFNIWVDPEAAKIVFDSGIEIIMAGLDVTQKAYILDAENEELKQQGNRCSQFVAELIEFYRQYHYEVEGFPGCTLHDPCAIAALIYPEIFEAQKLHVEIETRGEFTRGATIVDKIDYSAKIFGEERPKNVKFLTAVDREKFKELLFKDLKNLA